MSTKYKIVLIFLLQFVCFNVISQTNTFRFKLLGNGYTDETIIRLDSSATNMFDNNYDAWKIFSPNPYAPAIYTQVTTGQELSVNTLPEYTVDKAITIYTNITQAGTYTLDFEQIHLLTNNYKISLTENLTNTHYRLLGDTSITFTLNAQQNAPTFTFNISTAPLVATINETCYNTNDGEVIIENPGNTDWTYEIINQNNNNVVSDTANTTLAVKTNLAPSSYLVRVNSKGIIDEQYFTINAAQPIIASFSLNNDTVYLSEGGVVSLSNNSQGSFTYLWSFGDGDSSISANPSHTYTSTGTYNITLSASNGSCSHQYTQVVEVLSSPLVVTGVNELNQKNQFYNYGNSNFNWVFDNASNKQILVYNIQGKLIFSDVFTTNYKFSLKNFSSGVYIATVKSEDGSFWRKKIYNN